MALEESGMDPRLQELLQQASGEKGIPVLFVTRANRPLWLIMPEVTPPDGWHWKSDQARWLNEIGFEHNYTARPFIGHWELPHEWELHLRNRLLTRFQAYYLVERFVSAEASAKHPWTQVYWRDYELQYRLVTKLDARAELRSQAER